ncbi:MAG: hypothetical protein ACYDBH_06435 [Acidobacteriaceae bacterium]
MMSAETYHTPIPLVEGGVYYMGHSSLPTRIRILQIEKETLVRGMPSQRVRYERLPLRDRVPKPFYLDSAGHAGSEDAGLLAGAIRRGTETRLKQLQHTLRCAHGERSEVSWLTREIAHLQSVLDGVPVTPTDRIDCATLEGLVAAPRLAGDAWRLIDALTGGCCNGAREDGLGGTLYECSVFGTEGFRLLHDDPRIVFLRVLWNGEDVQQELLGRIGVHASKRSKASPA